MYDPLSQLPPDIVEDNLKIAKGMTMFGIPIIQLNKDELMALCYFLSEQNIHQRESHIKQLESL